MDKKKDLRKGLKTFIDCLCFKCPSHNACMKSRFQKVFCASDKSACTVEEKGCYCLKCKVAIEYGLDNEYYCMERGGR